MIKSKLHNGAGSRNNYVTVQRAIDAPANDVNEVLPEFVDLGDYFVGSKPTYGREFQAAMQTQPMLKAILELPYDSVTSTITPRDRIVDNGRIMNIELIFNENENNEKIIVWVVEPVQC